MLGELGTSAGALAIALSVHALTDGPYTIRKVHSSRFELVALVLFFGAFSVVLYNASEKENMLVGAILILLLGGLFPISVSYFEDDSRPVFTSKYGKKQSSWKIKSLSRVCVSMVCLIVLGVELIDWLRFDEHSITGLVAASVLSFIGICLSVYGMPMLAAPVALGDANEEEAQEDPKVPNSANVHASSTHKFIF